MPRKSRETGGPSREAGASLRTHVALLRGINVGGKNKLPMSEVTQVFTAAGCTDVVTYIQSGNVAFRAGAGFTAGLAALVERGLLERSGLRVPVVLRTAGELRDAAAHNAFLASHPEPDALHVAFLAGEPRPGGAAALDPERSPPDRFVLRGRELFLYLPNGVAKSKLTNAYLDAKLGTISTVRNWRTVQRLLELLAS